MAATNSIAGIVAASPQDTVAYLKEHLRPAEPEGTKRAVRLLADLDMHKVQLRLIVSKDAYIAQFRADGKGDFQTSASGKLAPGSDEKVSIQCYNGPADAEHWMRFSDFKILRLAE